MILKLVAAELRNRPGRAAFLLAGYSSGVAVMVVLLAVGQAMLTQARDATLLGGGDLIVVPVGISAEMLKAGGTASLFLGLDQARFIQRQLLESDRGRNELGIAAASPIVEARLVRVLKDGRTLPALASGEIPSRAAAVGVAPRLLAGRWEDSDADRRWVAPTPGELYDELDAFHLPYGSAVGDSTWAEWHYFNVVLDSERWLYLTFMLGGRVGVPGEWGGRLLMTLRDSTGQHRSFTRDVPDTAVRFDTLRADLGLDDGAWVRQRDGAYRVFARYDAIEVDLLVRPSPNRFFPPTELGGPGVVSGYTVPALAATARGRVCLPSAGAVRCEDVGPVAAYHDHNWGVWRDVSWEWGAASDAEVSLLYGVVRAEGVREQGLFAYLVDERGVRGLFRPRSIEPVRFERASVSGIPVLVPVELRFEDPRRGLTVQLEVLDHDITDLARDSRRFFVQMRGSAIVAEAGQPPRTLEGFFETFIDGESVEDDGTPEG